MMAGQDHSGLVHFLDFTALILLWSLSQGDFGGYAAAEVILAAPQKAEQGQDPSLYRTSLVFKAAFKANRPEENSYVSQALCHCNNMFITFNT